MQIECGAIGDRLNELLQNAVCEQDDYGKGKGGLRTLTPEGDQHREDPRCPGAEVRDVAADESDDGDRAGERDSEEHGPEPDDQSTPQGNDRHPDEVAAQALGDPTEALSGNGDRNTEMALDEAAERRRVLEHEEEAQSGE